ELTRAGFVQLDGDNLARELRRLSTRCRAEIERAFSLQRADDETRELRGPALRPDASLRECALVDAIDAVRARDVRRLTRWVAAHETYDRLRRLVLRAHQRERVLRAEVAHPHVGDPFRVRVLERSFGKRVEQFAHPVGAPGHDRV